jgi:hypothetical protein
LKESDTVDDTGQSSKLEKKDFFAQKAMRVFSLPN